MVRRSHRDEKGYHSRGKRSVLLQVGLFAAICAIMSLPVPCILDGYDQSAYWMRSVALKGCLQIGLVTRGSCTVVLGAEEHHLGQGSIVLVDPNNDIVTTQRSRDSRYSGILFDWMQRTVQAADKAQPDRVGSPNRQTWANQGGVRFYNAR